MNSCDCTWQSLVRWVMPHMLSPRDEYFAPPEAMVEAFVRKSAYDFMLKSGAVTKKVRMDVNAGVCDYTITCDEDMLSVKSVSIDGNVLDPRDYDVRDNELFLNRPSTCESRDGLVIEYSYSKCTDEGCGPPDDCLCGRYREAIINSTLASLYSMSNQDWYSQSEADKYGKMYTNEISSARSDARRRRSAKRGSIYDIKTRYIQ